MTDVLRGLLGLSVLVLIAIALSQNRRAIQPRVVLAALGMQIAIGALVLFVPFGRSALATAANGVNYVIEYGNRGIAFLFGGLVGPEMFKLFPEGGFVFALRVLPAIIYVSALIAVLYHLGVMRWIVLGLGLLFQKLLGVSRIESFSAVTTIFLGQSEMPAVLKPFARQLNGPELFTIMTSGMAAIAGSLLAGYAGLGVKLEYLIAASFMAVPGGLLFAKLICPSTEPSTVQFEEIRFDETPSANVIEAAASGAAVGLRVAVNVGAMLIAFVGLIQLVDGMVGGIMGWFGYPGLTIEAILGYAFSPLAWLIGIPWDEASIGGNLIGQKLILNEFVSYVAFSPYLKDAASVSAAGLTVLDPKTVVILSFALCGFANFSSIAILAGGFGAVAPELRPQVARYGLRVVAAATLSNLASATIAGAFLGSLSMDQSVTELIEAARAAREHAYAPYSHFHVGAAVRTRDGRIFSGCNVENASYGLCNCAERTALFTAIANGCRPGNFTQLAVIAPSDGPVAPCGACRQVMFELGGAQLQVIQTNLQGAVSYTTAGELLPGAFTL